MSGLRSNSARSDSPHSGTGFGRAVEQAGGFEHRPATSLYGRPWKLTDKRPRSISGVELDGDNLVRFVYIDESGISNEPVLVVAGVLIDADSQWKAVQQYLNELVSQYVLEEDRPGFIFHGSDLFHGSGKIWGKRDKYTLDHSREALKALLGVPWKFGLPVVFGYIKKYPIPPNLTPKQARSIRATNHTVAFSLCAIAAESFMHSSYVDPKEIATLVAENNAETHKAVREAHNVLAGTIRSEHDRKMFTFISTQIAPKWLPVRKIVDTVHFAEKHEASLLQIADAYALSIRYCLEEKANAMEFVNWFRQGHPALNPVSEDAPIGYNVLRSSPP
jgi:hypothetical protein